MTDVEIIGFRHQIQFQVRDVRRTGTWEKVSAGQNLSWTSFRRLETRAKGQGHEKGQETWWCEHWPMAFGWSMISNLEKTRDMKMREGRVGRGTRGLFCFVLFCWVRLCLVIVIQYLHLNELLNRRFKILAILKLTAIVTLWVLSCGILFSWPADSANVGN